MSTNDTQVMTQDDVKAPEPLPTGSSSFSFSDVANGLENGVERINDIAQAINDNKEPIKAGIDLFKMIVDSKTEGVSINNDAVMNILETIAKSTDNSLDDSILNTVKIALKLKF